MRPLLSRPRIILALGMMLPLVFIRAARAEFLPVFGSPTAVDLRAILVNDAGTAVGTLNIDPLYLPDVDLGQRVFRWDGSGMPPVELDALGVHVSGKTNHTVLAFNDVGVAVGSSIVFSADGVRKLGSRAVRWDGPGTAVTELGNLGTDASGVTYSRAPAINAAGTAVGEAAKYDASHNYLGQRAVRWDASSTVAVELEIPSALVGTVTSAGAAGINDAGVIMGAVQTISDGLRPVRWDASGTPQILDSIGPRAFDSVFHLGPINNAGTAVGYGFKYDASGTYLGDRAIRWDAGGTAATELRGLGTSADGKESSIVDEINDAGVIVGAANKYDEFGNKLGRRAVRWDPGSIVPTELDHLGYSEGRVYDINAAGVAVGRISPDANFDPAFQSSHPVYWLRDGTAVDLNTLIDPDSGWVLLNAVDISDTGWIAGLGRFDADGPGGEDPFDRLFLIHVPAAAVSLPGDYNHNGMVDAADYVVWRKNDGTPAGYDTWCANFGRTAGSGSALPSAEPLSASIPEPASLALMLLATVALLNSPRGWVAAKNRC